MQQSHDKVSAERLFAILGRSVATLMVVAILGELCSFALLLAYGKFHRDPLVPPGRVQRTMTKNGAASFGPNKAPFGPRRVATTCPLWFGE